MGGGRVRGKRLQAMILFSLGFMEFQMHWGTWNYNLECGNILKPGDHGYFCAFFVL